MHNNRFITLIKWLLLLFKQGGEIMEEGLSTILELAVSQGIWAVLYIYLFFRMLKENKEREERYQSTIDRLSTNIETGIEKIQDQLEAISSS